MEDLKQRTNNDDGRKTPVGCRPKFLRCLCQRFGGEGLTTVHLLDVDPSDAPYSVVVSLRTTAEYQGFLLARVLGDIFFEKRAAWNRESEGRAIDFGDLVPLDCVLRRVSEELFNLSFPALTTWRTLRDRMANEGSSWSPVRSEDLPEGLSERDEGTRSTEATPSVSGSSGTVGPDDSWTARIPGSDEVACSSRYGDVAFYDADFKSGVRFPLQPLMRELLDRLNLAPGQLAPNAWRTVVGSMVMWKVLSGWEGRPHCGRASFLLQARPNTCFQGILGLVSEKDDDFIRVRRKWGVPSSSALRRPKLDSDGHNRVLRALHHNEHHYKHFIRPELLALYSFGPEPSEAVLSLQEINQRRMATAKLNREKLKKMMSQQEEAPLTIGKKRKTETSSKKVMDERSLPPPAPKPSAPEPVPTSSIEVVEIPAEPSSSRFVEKAPTLPRDASLACRRAKVAVTKDDIAEYDKVNTDVIKVAGVHSLMKGLTELTVIANRCTQWEEALLKQKCQLSEAAQANQRLTSLVNELTLDRDRVVGELSSAKADLTRKDEDLRRALDDVKRADEQVKKLTSQLEVARVSAVEDFKSSEAYDDNNTKYFLSGFSFLKKQAKEKYPELDFEAFQPFDDDESVMLVGDDNAGPSTDPQMDDDATS
uniref:Uncharacterized protein n=1 Tax=Fagus sylvatica TaxID=28930 RepID=A0A2N9EJW5_FAGSY